MAGANGYPEYTEARTTDNELRSLVKIVQLLNDGAGGGGGGGITRVFRGSGNPNGAQSANGAAWYKDTDPGGAYYFHDVAGVSNTGWVEAIYGGA